jgi:hypothetical protein
LLYSLKKDEIKKTISEKRKEVNFDIKQSIKYQFSEESLKNTINILNDITTNIKELDIKIDISDDEKENLKEETKE